MYGFRHLLLLFFCNTEEKQQMPKGIIGLHVQYEDLRLFLSMLTICKKDYLNRIYFLLKCCHAPRLLTTFTYIFGFKKLNKSQFIFKTLHAVTSHFGIVLFVCKGIYQTCSCGQFHLNQKISTAQLIILEYTNHLNTNVPCDYVKWTGNLKVSSLLMYSVSSKCFIVIMCSVTVR